MFTLYRAHDAAGRLLYVGISKQIAKRLKAHQHSSEWFSACARISMENFDTKRQAEEAERHAILDEKPLHNAEKLPPGQPRWQDFMTPSEAQELSDARRKSDAARAMMKTLKSRAHARRHRDPHRASCQYS